MKIPATAGIFRLEDGSQRESSVSPQDDSEKCDRADYLCNKEHRLFFIIQLHTVIRHEHLLLRG